MHMSDPEEKKWIQERIEGKGKEANFTLEGKKAIFKKLVEAEGFENYCHTKFVGTKRFGLEILGSTASKIKNGYKLLLKTYGRKS